MGQLLGMPMAALLRSLIRLNMLVRLSPVNSWEFITAMSEAWAWAQARKRFYCATGGEQSIEEYLETAKAPNVRQIAVVRKGQMKAVITVRQISPHSFDAHVTAPKGTEFLTVLLGLREVETWLFGSLGAREVFTTCATYNGHDHKGSRRLAEFCGMTPTGEVRTQLTANGTDVIWREYSVTREKYYGKSETDQHNAERIPVLPKTEVGRTHQAK